MAKPDSPKTRSGARPPLLADPSKGGRARASVLSPEERRTIARQAARQRWIKAGKIPAETIEPDEPDEVPADKPSGDLPHSMFKGTIDIDDVEFEVHVLSDGNRVLSQREVVRALTGGRDSGDLSRYLVNLPLYQHGSLDERVIPFVVPGNPRNGAGYQAELLIEICDLYLQARDQKLLKSNQQHMARMAEIITRACAKVGIIALIDEATGYQKVRERNALQLKLQAFIAEDIQEWAKVFPDEFWYELARLEGVHYSPQHRPLRWGKYVMMFVYDAIDQDVGNTLRELNPNPRHRRNHHQWLEKYGKQRLHDQIQQVITIMKLCDDMNDFRRKFERVFSKGPLQLELGLD